jgi:hypothetical protein
MITVISEAANSDNDGGLLPGKQYQLQRGLVLKIKTGFS